MQPELDATLNELEYLWQSRCSATSDPIHTLKSLKSLDTQLAMTSKALRAIYKPLNFSQVSEISPTEIIAQALCYQESREPLVEFCCCHQKHHLPLLIELFSWLPFSLISAILNNCLEQYDQPQGVVFALRVYSKHNRMPQTGLAKVVKEPNPEIVAEWIRLFSEQGEIQRLGETLEGMESNTVEKWKEDLLNQQDDKLIIANLYYSALLAGDRSKAMPLFKLLIECKILDETKVILIFTCLDKKQLPIALNRLSEEQELVQLMFHGIAAAGYVKHIDWLISMMSDEKLAIYAYSAVCEILGLEIAELYSFMSVVRFAGESTEDVSIKNQLLQYQENVASWWRDNQSRFDLGARYFSGKKLEQLNWQDIYKNGTQWQRRRAALEIAASRSTNSLQYHASNQLVKV